MTPTEFIKELDRLFPPGAGRQTMIRQALQVSQSTVSNLLLRKYAPSAVVVKRLREYEAQLASSGDAAHAALDTVDAETLQARFDLFIAQERGRSGESYRTIAEHMKPMLERYLR